MSGRDERLRVAAAIGGTLGPPVCDPLKLLAYELGRLAAQRDAGGGSTAGADTPRALD